MFTSMRDSCIRRVRLYVCWSEVEFYWAILIQIYIYTSIFILRIAFEQSLCFLIVSRKQTKKNNPYQGSRYTFFKVWTFKGHLISDYSNDCSSSSSHSPFSVSDKTSDESDTTSGSSRVAAIIDYMHGRVWICNASCCHLESCPVTQLFPFIHDRCSLPKDVRWGLFLWLTKTNPTGRLRGGYDRWPFFSLYKLLYHIFSFDRCNQRTNGEITIPDK